MHFGAWLRVTRAQERDSGVDHRELACYPAKLTSYIQDHFGQALQSLEQVYMELPPTVIDDDEQRSQWEEYRAEFISRTREALDHIGAALSAVGCTDEQLERAGREHDNLQGPEEEPREEVEHEGDDATEDQEETRSVSLSDIPITVVRIAEK